MTLPVAARQTAFRLVDTARGSRTRPAVEEITRTLARPGDPASAELHARRLRGMLVHAATTARAFAGCSPDDLASYPVTDKNIIRERLDDYRSSAHTDGKLRRVSTSGSTGTPFASFQDPGKVARNSADTIAFARRIGYDVGAPVYYFTVWPARRGLAAVKQRLQNVTPVDVTRLDADQVAQVARRMSRAGDGANLIGYASAIEQFCVLVREQGISLPSGAVNSVLATSEAPSPGLAALVESVLRRPLSVRYSNIENGILAQRQPGASSYQLNTASYHVELLDLDTDGPAAPGEPGRIVVTDLFNRAMPFVRYDTGDVGYWHVGADGQADTSRLAGIEGRRSDLIYDADDALLSTHFVAKVMNEYVDVRQYQLVQTGQGAYTVRLNAPQDVARDERIAADFRRELGSGAQLTIEHTDEIPLLASGKRRRIISNWSPDR
ncbi:hypothetical protein FHE66_02310 [Georgenia sp. 311]|uniref:hypothetical protein n=1 Tax=Georgenia sp. 311 TaxID=2585134 RepID=UPI001111DD9D|nr:hypothetical protein [Georgenia sp. 311]TNC19703.1 hypothetical protein FHE66_02310 [Georgenia sp. 311]